MAATTNTSFDKYYFFLVIVKICMWNNVSVIYVLRLLKLSFINRKFDIWEKSF